METGWPSWSTWHYSSTPELSISSSRSINNPKSTNNSNRNLFIDHPLSHPNCREMRRRPRKIVWDGNFMSLEFILELACDETRFNRNRRRAWRESWWWERRTSQNRIQHIETFNLSRLMKRREIQDWNPPYRFIYFNLKFAVLSVCRAVHFNGFEKK